MSVMQMAGDAVEKVVRRAAKNPDKQIRRRVTYDASLIGHDTETSCAAPAASRPPLSRATTKDFLPGLDQDSETPMSKTKSTSSSWFPGQHSAMRSAVRKATEEALDTTSRSSSKSGAASRSASRSASKKEPRSLSRSGSKGSPGGSWDLSRDLVRQTMARRIRRKVELDQDAVVRILQIFEEESATGSLEIGSFRNAVRRIGANRDLNENGVRQAWKVSGNQEESNANTLGGVEMMEFCQWWAMEEKWAQIKAGAAWQATPEALQELSVDRGVDVPVLEKVKSIYDEFDDNRTGIMDFSEFGEALKDLLKLDKMPEEDFTKKMWTQLDQDDSGEVDFPEFARWYLESFDSSTGESKATAQILH